VAPRYGLDGSGIESLSGRDFPHPSRPAMIPILQEAELAVASCRMGTSSFLGVKRLGIGVNHQFPSHAEVKERVELHLCAFLVGDRVKFTFLLIRN
jgi:hypothetical protein